MTKEIQVGKSSKALVDNEDYDRLSQYKWRLILGYAVRDRQPGEAGPRTISMHREIMRTPKGYVCEHDNGNRLDNRKENLRSVTHGGAARHNKKALASSQYKGVSKLGRTNRWRAAIRSGGETINLGWYESEYDAAVAYNSAAVVIYGEYANLNEGVPVDPDFLKRAVSIREPKSTVHPAGYTPPGTPLHPKGAPAKRSKTYAEKLIDKVAWMPRA